MIHIYHPNKNSTGFACSFWNSDKDSTIFATLVKQSGWDDKTQNGTFKASFEDVTKHVNIKLSDTEAAAILDCIERNRPFSSFHDNEETPKTIQFSPWMTKPTDGTTPVIKGYSFAITVTNKQDSTQKNSFYIGLTFPEARLIREYLLFCLNRHFSFAATKVANTRNTAVKKADSTPAPEPLDGF